jgi:hypothetical protein
MTAEEEKLISVHEGYRKLKSFQIAQLVYDVTVRFCEKYVSRFSRTYDRSGSAKRSSKYSRRRDIKKNGAEAYQCSQSQP